MIEKTSVYHPIAILGHSSGSGKDWVAEQLINRHNYRLVKCANLLRQTIYKYFDLPLEKMGDRPWECSYEIPSCQGKQYYVKLKHKKEPIIYESPTVQDMTIIVGAIVSHYSDDIAIFAQYAAFESILSLDDDNIPVISDVRQSHELEMFKSMGFITLGLYNHANPTMREVDGLLVGREDYNLDNTDKRLKPSDIDIFIQGRAFSLEPYKLPTKLSVGEHAYVEGEMKRFEEYMMELVRQRFSRQKRSPYFIGIGVDNDSAEWDTSIEEAIA